MSSNQLLNKTPTFVPQSLEFENVEEFLAVQKRQRVENLKTSGGQKVLMLSHSWRDRETQLPKRRLVAALGLNGDFPQLLPCPPLTFLRACTSFPFPLTPTHT